MPKKRDLAAASSAAAPSTVAAGVSPGSLVDSVAQTLATSISPARPDAITSERAIARGQTIESRDTLKAVSDGLQMRFWANNKQFDWSRNPYRHRYVYTRQYFDPANRDLIVLVDVWPNATAETRKDVERKRTSILAENEAREARGQQPIGYLGFVRGAVVPFDAFERARAGEVLPLIEKERAEAFA